MTQLLDGGAPWLAAIIAATIWQLERLRKESDPAPWEAGGAGARPTNREDARP